MENSYIYDWFHPTSESVTITFRDYNEEGELVDVSNIEVDKGTVNEMYYYEPERTGYEFDGWFYNDEEWDFSQPFNTDLILVAHYSAINYTITYYLSGGVNHPDNPATYTIETPTFTLKTPTRDGYTFTSWENVDQPGSVITSWPQGQTGDRELMANWTLKQYRISLITPTPMEQRFEDVVSSRGNLFGLTRNGDVYVWQDGIASDNLAYTDIPVPYEIKEGGVDLEIQAIAAGESFYHFLSTDGELYAAGVNSTGNLATGTKSFLVSDTPARISFPNRLVDEEIVDISALYRHSIALTSKNRIYTWGSNNYGQLGLGDNSERLVPTLITLPNLNEEEVFIDVISGWDYSLALTSEGRVFAWGYNTWRTLGDGTNLNRNVPTEIFFAGLNPSSEKIASLEAGYDCAFAITNTGRLYGWGRNGNEQLTIAGIALGAYAATPTAMVFAPTILESGEVITQVSYYNMHILVTTSQYRTLAWGSNMNGQLGISGIGYTNHATPREIVIPTLEAIEHINIICAFHLHSFIVSNSGKVFVFGVNTDLELGMQTSASFSETPLQWPEKTFTFIFVVTLYEYRYAGDALNLAVDPYSANTLFKFEGYYADMEFTIPFTTTIMPANDIIVYRKISYRS